VKTLGIIAHPDDECIFGWPIFQNKGIDKFLLMIVSDRLDSSIKTGDRISAFKEVCEKNEITFICLDLNSEFYRVSLREGDKAPLREIYDTITDGIKKAIEKFDPDFVFTHNPHGEYGMPDHKIIFEIVYNHPDVKNLLITDICEEKRVFPSFEKIPESEYKLYYEGKPHFKVKLNPEFYIDCKNIYEKYNCWTWKKRIPPEYPKSESKLYLIKGESDKFNDLKIYFD